MTTEQKSFFVEPRIVEPTPQITPSLIVLSGPLKLDLAVYRGDSGGFRISVKDINDQPVDISAATWDADIRQTAPSTSVITNFDVVPVSGDTSSIDVLLSPENSELLSGNCVYDIEMTLGTDVITLIGGSITVTQDVSRP